MNFDYNIDPIHLRTHEVTYELKIRGISPSKADIILRRKCLRESLKNDLGRADLKYTTPNFDFSVEKAELDSSIKTLQELVDEYDGIKDDVHKRFNSRYNHIMGRLSRFIIDETIPEISEYKNDKVVLIASMAADIHDIRQRTQQKTVRDRLPITTAGMNSVPLYKWGVTFDGSTKRESVNSFLQRVEELRIARNTSKEMLYQSAVDLFTGQGILWYRSIRDTVTDWDSLAAALKQDFLPPDYDDELWIEIRNRTQGQHEKIVIFLAAMKNLFSRLTHNPSEEQMLRILRKNILPAYQVHIALKDVDTVDELGKLCKKLEDVNSNLQRSRPQLKQNIASLEPDLACAVQVNDYCKSKHIRSKHVAELKCWSCNQTGHIKRDCTKQSKNKIYCHGCGKPGVIKPNCRCSKNMM